MLGQQGAAGSGASFALHSGKTLLFSLAIKAIMDSIDDVLNRFAIPRLMHANGWPLGAAPHHEFGDIETDEFVDPRGYEGALRPASPAR